MTDSSNTPRPQKRRFGGSLSQIRTALNIYRVMAYTTGVMLLLLTAEVIVRYVFGYMLIAGGTDAASGAAHGFGFVHVNPDGSLPLLGGFNISLTVLIVHGWLYVVYLLSDLRLWSVMRWSFGRFILIALGGVIPFLSFFVESHMYKKAMADIAAHPQASTRY